MIAAAAKGGALKWVLGGRTTDRCGGAGGLLPLLLPLCMREAISVLSAACANSGR